MVRSRRVRAFVAAGVAASLTAILLHGCSEQVTEPISEARGRNPRLTVGTGSSSASGTVTSSPGSINCAITGSTGGASTSGPCSQRFPPGTVVTLTATPASGAILKLDQEWVGCVPDPADRRICQVTLNNDTTVGPTFVPASTAFNVTVSGGAGGSGTVISTPIGINCTITNGQASSGNCSAGFNSGTQVKLTATAASGSYLKAWAGGGCETSGTGVGFGSGSCTFTVNANIGVVVSFETTAGAGLGKWDPPINWPAIAIHAALLPNGTVMTYSRTAHVPIIWDPANPTSFTDLTEPADLFCSGLALLPDGRLFVAGGHSGVDNIGIKTAYTYDVNAGWFRAPDMSNGRWYPTVTTLSNGEALAISGGDVTGALNVIPELYNPASNTWRALTSASRSIPYYPMMFNVPVPAGQVYYVGPDQATAYLDPSGTGTWTAGPTRTCCYRDYGSGVMYATAKILVIGGGNTPTNTAERIDLGGTATWTSSGTMSVARRQMNATILADGTVLVTGGTDAVGFNTAPTTSTVLAAELWDQANPTVWKKLASMTHNRLYHSIALLLPDGRVLSAGSGAPAATGLSDDYTAEIFSPPYLFKLDGTPATRPTITSAPTSIAYGAPFTIQTPDAASITKVTFIRLGAVTHSTNMNQRNNNLAFTAGSGTLSISPPTSSQMAPPGHYMLFIINSNGVPSVSKIIGIN
jgi:hypothetical protein